MDLRNGQKVIFTNMATSRPFCKLDDPKSGMTRILWLWINVPSLKNLSQKELKLESGQAINYWIMRKLKIIKKFVKI